MSQVLPTVSDCCNECCSTATVDCTVAGAGVVVDTIALLKLETFSDDKTVWLLGDLAKGDGGGGLYYFDALSTAAEALPAVVMPTALTAADAGRWLKHI